MRSDFSRAWGSSVRRLGGRGRFAVRDQKLMEEAFPHWQKSFNALHNTTHNAKVLDSPITTISME